MIQLYYAPRSRGVRVVWLLEEMGVPYEIVPAQLGKTTPEMTAHNPAQTIPVLVDGKIVLTESVTMLDYIAETYGPTPLTIGRDHPDYWEYRQLLLFGEATLAGPLNSLIATALYGPEDQKVNWTNGAIRTAFAKRLGVVRKRLEQGDYMIGDAFSLADISVAYAVALAITAPVIGLGDLMTPDLQAYYDRVSARPAYQRMIKVK
jgi:glutathione S-transferase